MSVAREVADGAAHMCSQTGNAHSISSVHQWENAAGSFVPAGVHLQKCSDRSVIVCEQKS